MLRFIEFLFYGEHGEQVFQYISCYGLSYIPMRDMICRRYFNTSHVTVYQNVHYVLEAHFQNFNTSHVTVYPDFSSSSSLPLPNFNTSHVTVYRLMLRSILRLTLFQYISCYGLSEKLDKFHDPEDNFNTSHVTVYPKKTAIQKSKMRNFNTSHVTVYPKRHPYKRKKRKNFNTSHVTVYRDAFSGFNVLRCYFNTSHVTVYPIAD